MGIEKRVSLYAVQLLLLDIIHLIEWPNIMKGIKQEVKSDLQVRYADPDLMLILNKACFWILALNH